MAQWTFPLAVTVGPQAGTVIAELPLRDVRLIDRLNAPGSLSADMPLETPSAALFLQPQGSPNSPSLVQQSALYALRDGVMMGGPYYLADGGAQIDIASGSFSVAFSGWFELLRRRVIRNASAMSHATLTAGEVRFAQVDQFEIVADLVAHAQAVNGGDLGITVEWSSLSGVERDRSYEADKGKTVGESIEQLAAVENGFDWAILTSGTPESPTIRLQLFHPQRGRNTGYAFIFSHDGMGSSNVLGATITSGPAPVTRFSAIGPGEGAAQLTAHVADPSLLEVVPLNEQSGSWLDVQRRPTLRSHATRNLRAGGARGDMVAITADPNAVPKLGSYAVGDIATVDLRTQTVADEAVVALSGEYRIITRTINVSVDGAETVDIDFAHPGRF